MRSTKIMDGNTAAAHVAYAFSELAAIYPITPSSPMAEQVDTWSSEGKPNLWGSPVSVTEMQSEGGAAGVLHGALSAGALATTFTSSQGLLLMLPNLYKIAGERLPAVVYVAARSIASHALSIFGDHSDVYAARPAGLALLALSSVQEIMDLAPVAHAAALTGRIPFMPFFDGFRTSHELQKIEVWSEEELRSLIDCKALADFRQRSLSPSHPILRGSAENGDLFFQHREASNPAYNALPDITQQIMDRVNDMTGQNYRLFGYYGAPDAERVIAAMGSVCECAKEVVDHLLSKGEKVGLVQVRLYHPFDSKRFLTALPVACRRLAVLDRGKEPGAFGEPLYLEIAAALSRSDRTIEVLGGRYGLGSKDTPPSAIMACFEHLKQDHPHSPFTLGIIDDVTHLSLPAASEAEMGKTEFACQCWGIGGDGMVSAVKSAAKLLGGAPEADGSDRYVQAYFQYDSKKTGGVTVAHLRTARSPIRSSYYVRQADMAICGQIGYLRSDFPIVDPLKEGGILLIATGLSPDKVAMQLAVPVKRLLAQRKIRLYLFPVRALAEQYGTGKRTGMLLVSAMLALSKLLPPDQAETEFCALSSRAYASKGGEAVKRTTDAIHAAFAMALSADSNTSESANTHSLTILHMPVPEEWADLRDEASEAGKQDDSPDYVKRILRPVSRMRGDELPVSALAAYDDGSLPAGTSAYEKRGIAELVSSWDPIPCIQCGRCSFVCPHAAIRACLLNPEEKNNAPKEMKFSARPALPMKTAAASAGSESEAADSAQLAFAIVISPEDCTGCTLCTKICPTHALSMKKREDEQPQQAIFQYAQSKVNEKTTPWSPATVKGIQFSRPLLEFSGACAGCAQASYARLATQLFGRRMIISNATGCSSIWGGSAPVSPYTTHPADGKGPAWANSLFEDNAEHGLGIYLAHKTQRQALAQKLERLRGMIKESENKARRVENTDRVLLEAIDSYFATYQDGRANQSAADRLVGQIQAAVDAAMNCQDEKSAESNRRLTLMQELINGVDSLAPKSVWMFGGDGWAYDIGLGGLLHVLSSGANVNVLVFDTEVYSNTGGQASGASRIGQVARFAGKGRVLGKKSLAEIVLTLGNVYVAQIAMGADLQQTLTAFTEAEAYPGPSLILAYSPCELHGIGGGMGESQNQMKRAVECGYVTLFRYMPGLQTDLDTPSAGKLTLDSSSPKGDFRSFLLSENRYARLVRENPEEAEKLLTAAEQAAKLHRQRLVQLSSKG